MSVEKCEKCKHWEPIPFHDNGGVCMDIKESVKPKYVAPQVSSNKTTGVQQGK